MVQQKLPPRNFNVGDEVYIVRFIPKPTRRKPLSIKKGVVDYWSYNEMQEGAYLYYVKVGKNYSRYVCVDPTQYTRGLLSMTYIYHSKEEALRAIKEKEEGG